MTIETTQTELELGAKSRHIDKLSNNLKAATSKNEKLERLLYQMEKENKSFKYGIIEVKEEIKKVHKDYIQEKKRGRPYDN